MSQPLYLAYGTRGVQAQPSQNADNVKYIKLLANNKFHCSLLTSAFHNFVWQWKKFSRFINTVNY